MKKRELITGLSNLPDDCEVLVETTASLAYDFRLTTYNEPEYAYLTLISDGVDDDDIEIVVRNRDS
jgi:hypothetical protein